MPTFILLIGLSAVPLHPLDRRDAKTRMEHHLNGAFLAMQIGPGTNEARVQALLGEPGFLSFSAGTSMCCYEKVGVRLFWRHPSRIWAPAWWLGTQEKLLISAVPTWWVRLIVVPFLWVEYAEPPVLVEVDWLTMPIYLRQP